RNRFTLTDPNPKAPDLLRLSVDVDLRYEPPDPNKKTDKLPFTIKKGTLRSDPEWSTGFVLYDPKAGLPVRAETRVKLAGDLTIDLGGTEVEVGLAQDQATIIEFSTKPFLK
ncbi:MAG TPA: hypothetical protein VKE74_27325, partial [Gemmataceae bacterium]|nr:hypothetical protein [Gemmataceae bacterium]